MSTDGFWWRQSIGLRIDDPVFERVSDAKVEAYLAHGFKRIRTLGTPSVALFAGECKCGERSANLSTAGMVHGWHARHRQERVDAVA